MVVQVPTIKIESVRERFSLASATKQDGQLKMDGGSLMRVPDASNLMRVGRLLPYY